MTALQQKAKLFFLLVFLSIISVQVRCGNDLFLFCPGCAHKFLMGNQRFDFLMNLECPNCHRQYERGFFAREDLPQERPPASTTRQSSSMAATTGNLDLTVRISNDLRERDRNLVFSPTGIMNSVVPLLLSSDRLPLPIAGYVRGYRSQAQTQAQTQAQAPFSRRGVRTDGRGVRSMQLFATRSSYRFTPEVLRAAEGAVAMPYTPGDGNQEIRRAITEFMRNGFSSPSALNIPVPQISTTAVFGLYNVLTFDGRWAIKFEPVSLIRFQPQRGLVTYVHSIGFVGEEVRYAHSENRSADPDSTWQAVELPYRPSEDGRTFRMLAILPPRGSEPGSLTSGIASQLIASLSARRVTLSMPNFKISSTHNLSEERPTGSILGDLYSVGSFSPEAVFPPVLLDRIDSRQDIVFLTNQHGSRAAAVTSTEINEAYLCCPDATTITFDRPYIAMVVDQSGIIHIYAEIYRPQ